MAVSVIIYGVLLIVVVIIVVMLSVGGDGSVTKQNSFYSEEEALKVLGIRKESLNTMVSEEILRAYPHNNGISYRKEDIEELSRNHKSSQEQNMSPVYKKFYKEITTGFFIAIATIALGYLPYDDFWQGAWVFLSTSTTAWIALKTRVKESDADRYSRLAKGYFRYWINKDPQKVEGLFANNVPYSVVEWFKKEENCNLLDCRVPHVVDSWCRVGDEPGELIFRSGLNLGKMLSENDDKEIHEFFSEKFTQLTKEKRKLLGEEVAPHVFYKELTEGDYRPTGVHISDPYSECLIIRERRDWDGTISERISLGLKQDYLEELSDEEWEVIKKTIIFKHCPYFKPAGGGSGPQKKQVPLFLTEKNLSSEELTRFPEIATQIYNEIKQYIDEKNSKEEQKKERENQEKENEDHD